MIGEGTINPEKYKDLFFSMLRIRIVEEMIADEYVKQEMRCPMHLCIGQEAIPVGVSAHLDHNDTVIGAHRSHGHYLAQGGDLKAMIAELYGKATGCAGGVGGSMHLIDLEAGVIGTAPIVGSTIAIGTGVAFSNWMKGNSFVMVVYLGDGSVEEGVFYESANFAALHKLPVLYVCENNLFSVYSPLNVRQPKGRNISDMVESIGIESHQADGNDLDAVYQLSERAVAKARRGEGPSFLEFFTYRRREHVGPYYDNDLGYRSESEYQEWVKRCPVAALEKKMLDMGLLREEEIKQMRKDIGEEVDFAIDTAKQDPYPDPSKLYANIYR